MKKFRLVLCLVALCVSSMMFAQFDITGYIYETGNRGYIADAEVQVKKGSDILAVAMSDQTGQYILKGLPEGVYTLLIAKSPFVLHEEQLELKKGDDSKQYLKHEIQKLPGYVFEITLAEKDRKSNGYQSGLSGALVEVYNNTTREEHLVIEALKEPEFKINFIKGNHYTILIRHKGYLAKRMEAFVDVAGCILCFEGVGQVTPGVSDNLTNENANGVLLANVELEKFEPSKIIDLNDIYYQTNKSSLTKKAKRSLDNVAIFIKDNPQLILELGAHTDSQGKSDYNLRLSQDRAKEVVKYLINYHGIPAGQLVAHGYGEGEPVNNCRNNCSEAEHAQNRRTELKILEEKDGVRRSLRQMKLDEHMDSILEELESEGQIRISESKDDDAGLGILEGTLEDDIEQKASISSEEENRIIEEAKEEGDGQRWVAHQAVPVSADDSASGSALEGYKIVIHFSRFELPLDHPLHERFEDLSIYTTADGNKLYLIETFETRRQAENRLSKRYASSFPSAYVVGFKSGIIVD